MRVKLDPSHVVDREILVFAQQFADALGAIAGGMVCAENIGVLIADHLVIGGDDHSASGIVCSRQLIEGDLFLPVIFTVPSGRRPPAVAFAADRDRSLGLIAGIALRSGVVV